MALTFSSSWVAITPELDRLRRVAGKPSRALTGVMARQVRNELQTHFARRHVENPNRLGAPRAGFWLQVRQSVQQPVFRGTASAEVVIADPRLAQKVYGGTIRAKRGKALTIPVHPAAYNRRAGTISGLVLLSDRGKKGDRVGLLVKPRPDKGFPEVYYLLKRSVTQGEDPEALPDFGALRRAALRRAEVFLRR